MHKIHYTVLVIFIFYCTVFAQYHEDSNQTGIGLPFFEYTFNRQFNTDFEKTNVNIFAQILYDDLTFIRSDTSGYDAELEWLIAVYSDDNQLIFSRTSNKKINVDVYDLTNSRTSKVTLKSDIPLDPGKYSILLRVIDLNTNKSSQKRLNIDIPDYYKDALAISDILFLRSVTLDSSRQLKDYQPILGNNFTVKEGQFYLYFSVYSKELNKTAKIQYKFINDKQHVDFDSVTFKPVKSLITSHILKINKNIFKKNKYDIIVNVTIGDNSKEISKRITFFWKVVPNTLDDIDEALRQMVYILPSDSLSHYLNASLAEKQNFFKRFWHARDPNPKTEKNELMDEYFKRVNYANQNYSSLSTDGWLTDRGRILIKFGYPDDIERHPFELESHPYEVWRYYSLRKIFLFVDYTGFGDYRLDPAYMNVEYQ